MGIKMRAPHMLVRFTVTLSTREHLLYWQRHKPAPLEIAITRQSLPRSRLEYCSAARLPSRCRKENRTATKKTAARPYWRTPSHGSQLAATRRAPPGVLPAARLYQKKNARLPFSGPQFLPTASQLAATQRTPPGVQPAARPDKKKERSTALFRATVYADLLRIIRGCRGKYRHPTHSWEYNFM
jgi:hypothetical protein